MKVHCLIVPTQLLDLAIVFMMLVSFAKVSLCWIWFLKKIIIGVGVAHDNCTDYAVRFVDGATAREGKVQICLNRVWGTFCYRNNYNYDVDASIICRELGYNS